MFYLASKNTKNILVLLLFKFSHEALLKNSWVCIKCGANSGIFLFDSEIDKTIRAIRISMRIAKEESNKAATISIQDFSSDESEMEEVSCITLGDNRRFDHLC